MKCNILATVITGALALVSTVQAEESGTGHYVSGATASFIDTLPDQPGWILESLFMNYNGIYGESRGLPFGQSIALNVSARASAESALMMYTPPLQILGGHPSFAVAVPYVWVDVKARVTTQVRTRAKE